MSKQLIIAGLFLLAVIASVTFAEASAINANAPNGNPLQALASSISDKIKHIIILMEENRSFDHMFGFYGKGTNGLTGKEYNLVDVANPDSKRIYVDNKAPYINQCDPVHGLNATTAKIFGTYDMGVACNFTCEAMSGFAQYEAAHADNNYCNVMEALDYAEKLPVLTALADNYVLMDRFFCSVPGPTWPNRLFHLAASSGGDTSTGPFYHNVPGKLYPMKTIFDQVGERGGEWKLYYNDTPWEMMLTTLAHHPENMASMDEFFADCENGNLPDYAFINPRIGINVTSGIGANDQHPDHDIRAGERFYKDVYEALRASPQWNETLFIITYDEHGGFYDHVTPPLNAPIPDDEKSYPSPFLFNRLGIRIPTLLISPWVPKGLVVSRAPDAQRPQPDSEYDLTSIMASARKILKKLEGAPPLTKRDAWASTFEHVLDMLPEARTDCPEHLPDPQPPQPHELAAEASQPINDLQADILHMHHVLANPHVKHHDRETYPHPKHLTEQSHVGDYLQHSYKQHAESTLAWKGSKRSAAGKGKDQTQEGDTPASVSGTPIPNAIVMYGPGVMPNLLSNQWMVRKSDATAAEASVYMTISTHLSSNPSQEVCLDAYNQSVGAELAVSICYPSSDPNTNRDVDQQWIYGPDTTIRPRKDTSLCITTDVYVGDAPENPYAKVFLAPCEPENVRQRHGYDGDAAGARPTYGIWCGASFLQVSSQWP